MRVCAVSCQQHAFPARWRAFIPFSLYTYFTPLNLHAQRILSVLIYFYLIRCCIITRISCIHWVDHMLTALTNEKNRAPCVRPIASVRKDSWNSSIVFYCGSASYFQVLHEFYSLNIGDWLPIERNEGKENVSKKKKTLSVVIGYHGGSLWWRQRQPQ